MIQPAIKDLFDDAPSSADIVTVMASEYVPLDVAMKYGVVRAAVLRAKPRSVHLHRDHLENRRESAGAPARRRRVLLRRGPAHRVPRAVTEGIMDRETLAFKFAGIWMKRTLGRGAGDAGG